MKKIIVKHKLGCSREKFLKKLGEMEMSFRPAYYQHDRVYVPRSYKPDANYARMVLRTEVTNVKKPARYRMILKRHIADSGVDVVNSTIVKDYAEAVHILHQLGFEKKAEIARQREELKLAEGSKMYLDKIEGRPGYYVKIESELSDDERVYEVTDEIETTFRMLGMGSEDALKETYADLKTDE